VAPSPWQQRIARAEALSRLHPFAAEILTLYMQIAHFQEQQYRQLEKANQVGSNLPQATTTDFLSFLSHVEQHGPKSLSETARNLRQGGKDSLFNLLNACWLRSELSPSEPQEFLARAFLQPYAARTRIQSNAQWNGYSGSTCPFCARKPGGGVLRQKGDGGSRYLLCSFCLAEWEFRRILCAGCGEEDYRKLPVYTASDFDYIRVECCETCKQYLKTVDLTKNGLADGVVDEIAAAPLDLWAREQGYSKLELNLVGM